MALADLITSHEESHILEALDALAVGADRTAALAELRALVRALMPSYWEANFIFDRVEELCAVGRVYDQSFAPLPDEACVLHVRLRERHIDELSKGYKEANLDLPALVYQWLDEALHTVDPREHTA